MNPIRFWLAPVLAVLVGSSCARLHRLALPPLVENPECEHLRNPMGIDSPRPRFAWKLVSNAQGERQTAYRLLAASSEELLARDMGDLWDSSEVKSDQSTLVEYAGRPLQSRERCFWKVLVWDQAQKKPARSLPARFTMGLLRAEDWQAQWIGLEGAKDGLKAKDRTLPARYLRKEFAADKTIKHATVSVCGLGLFELYVNGRKVGDHVLEPALSEYDKRAYYETFDVTGQMQAGANAVGVILGNGRFFGPRAPRQTTTFGYPKLRLQLDLEYADGTTGQMISDASWKISTNGPIRANNEYDGEEYDARLEMKGWAEPRFDDASWQAAEIVQPGAPELSAQMIPPIKVIEVLHPIKITPRANGAFIYDLGQNMVGWCRLTAKGPAGTKITLRHAETLQPDGSLYVDNLRTAKATDTYTMSGAGNENYAPRFTYHGFRFVEVTGYPGTPTLGDLEGCVVHDALPEAGSFACSNPLINQIEHNIRWGVRGNYRSMPTDCPQRDERQGWTGDRSEESKGEMFLYDVSAFYSKWLQDLQDAQHDNGSVPDVAPAFWTVYNDGVSWASTYLILAHAIYEQYGDLRPLQTHYDSMRKWIDYTGTFASNGIISKNSYGDWCVPPETLQVIHSKDPKRLTDGAVISTAYYYRDLRLMERAAALLDHPEDRARFQKMADDVKAAYNRAYLDASTGRYANGTPTSSVLSLGTDIAPVNDRKKTFGQLVNHIETQTDDHIGTGVIGCQWLMRTLSDMGRIDLAYHLTTNTTYPSWGYMAEKGATTIWELWNGNTADPAMNSGNHVMLIGDLNIWLNEYLAGIRPAAPGYKKILIEPVPCGDLTWAKATHESPYGTISSSWQRANGKFVLDVTIPPNTTATVILPDKSERTVEAGRYTFRASM
ncbi:MAG TPA: glycoside hydrolase family 78 protein [Verrucomicrobiae bacterium]|jgi:alpha-L-rhamnosidase|nr:glycoside hydrolase family 78 protein [Verrucomicrobiae bacterium]